MSRLTVLLTGAGGRIGPHILPTFQERFDLRVLDRKPVPGIPDTIISDLSDAAVLIEAMRGVDVLVHLAAQADEAPFLDVLVPNNIVGLYNTFDAARETGVKRIVFASTVQTIGFYPREHTVEISDPPRPVSLYGATKVFGETVGRWYYDRHGIQFVGVRIGAFQPYDSPHLRDHAGLRDIWLSPRDCANILALSVEKEDVGGYALLFATSITPFERLSRTALREILGYVPVDDARELFPPRDGEA